jgi:NAD(P)-dependent dehydrogenase (short-subunit alcohol dehydrogenase family)
MVHLAAAALSGKRFEEPSAEEFRRTLDQALPFTFVLCRTLAERMKARGSGSIVLFSSTYRMASPEPRIDRTSMAPSPID